MNNITQDTNSDENLLNKIRGFIDAMKIADYELNQEIANVHNYFFFFFLLFQKW